MPATDAVATDKGLCMDIRQKRAAAFAAPALDPGSQLAVAL
jgi:hypothetical protein